MKKLFTAFICLSSFWANAQIVQGSTIIKGRLSIQDSVFTGGMWTNMVANNSISMNCSGIGEFMRVGPLNIIDFKGQKIVADVFGAELNALKFITNPVNGYVMTSDASGNISLKPQSSGAYGAAGQVQYTNGTALRSSPWFTFDSSGTWPGTVRARHFGGKSTTDPTSSSWGVNVTAVSCHGQADHFYCDVTFSGPVTTPSTIATISYPDSWPTGVQPVSVVGLGQPGPSDPTKVSAIWSACNSVSVWWGAVIGAAGTYRFNFFIGN